MACAVLILVAALLMIRGADRRGEGWYACMPTAVMLMILPRDYPYSPHVEDESPNRRMAGVLYRRLIRLARRGDASWLETRMLFAFAQDAIDNNSILMGRAALKAVPDGTPGLHSVVIAMLKSESAIVRAEVALYVLKHKPQTAHESSDAMLELLAHDPSRFVRRAAAHAIGDARVASDLAGPALLAALQDDCVYVRAASARALAKVRAEPARTIPELLALLQSADSLDRSAAAEALGAFEGHPEVIAHLIEALEDPTGYVRYSAMRSLGELGPSASDALHVVRALHHSPDSAMSYLARQAAQRIEGRSSDRGP
jgi:hypothetical protein